MVFVFFFSSRRRHTRCALVTGVQTCALPIWGIRGTLLLAREGINGTIAGSAAAVSAAVAHIRVLPGCADLDVKYSAAAVMPFGRLKVRLKTEIVTMKVPGLDPAREAGATVAPADWTALVDDPDTDVKNGRASWRERVCQNGKISG